MEIGRYELERNEETVNTGSCSLSLIFGLGAIVTRQIRTNEAPMRSHNAVMRARASGIKQVKEHTIFGNSGFGYIRQQQSTMETIRL